MDTTSSSTSGELLDVVKTVARVPANQLCTLLLQQPVLPRIFVALLRSLAKMLLAFWTASTPREAFRSVVYALENAMRSADPSLVGRLLPSPDAALNMALMASCSTDADLVARARRLMLLLIDRYTSEEVLLASVQSLKEIVVVEKGEIELRLLRLLRVISALLGNLPTSAPARCGREQKRRGKIDELASVLAPLSIKLKGRDMCDEETGNVLLKIALLDCAAALLARASLEDGASRIVRLISALDAQSKTDPIRMRQPLSLSLLAELTLVQPALLERLEALLKTGPTTDDNRKSAISLLQAAKIESAKATSSNHLHGSRSNLWSIGGTLQAIVQRCREARAADARNGLDRSSAGEIKLTPDTPSPALLSLIEAVLPGLARDTSSLKRILSEARFRGRSDEQVVQLLLDQEETKPRDFLMDESQPRSSQLKPYQSVLRRANVFDGQPLDTSQLKWKGQRGESSAFDRDGFEKPLPASLRSAILARVQAQRSEAEHQAGEEWDPFAAENVFAQSHKISFEEELDDDDDYERLDSRIALSTIKSPKGNASGYAWRLEGCETSSAAGEDSENEHGPRGRMKAPVDDQPSEAYKEKEGERILIRAYSAHGPQLFDGDPTSRKSEARKMLKRDLEVVTGRTYDDGLIESWGTMFNRNVSVSE